MIAWTEDEVQIIKARRTDLGERPVTRTVQSPRAGMWLAQATDEDLAKARERTKEVEAQREDMRDLWHREQADHMLTLGNLKDQTRIAGLLAVGGKTSYQPQIEDRLEKNMTARAGCAPRHRG